ncbi:enolase-phosphatase E1 [Orussus abietinus]|uniref:enolase-phosphatase E1 n=1 Tax=Orussus abietinus TaxID=222816 RepID=UPI000626460C|nr:enolase-phosphatase E1 [Orussus abietinus]
MAGEKRSQDQEECPHEETTILLDIEGTTTSIGFVKETLFSYARDNVKKYIEAHWEEDEFKADLEKLKEQAVKDEEEHVDGIVPIISTTNEEERESLIKNILWQMDNDRKTGALKQLQGHMWREAYKSGTIKGHVYDDVPKALQQWTSAGRKVYVYSSGSVEAQKLLFGHSDHGDLLKHFSGHFDTEVGPKQEASSYKNILSKIGAEPSSVLFFTDVVKEARAAKEAGLSTIVVTREGNAALAEEDKVSFTCVKSFLDLSFQTSSKRQKLDASASSETAETSSKVAAGDAKESPVVSEDVEMTDISEKSEKEAKSKEVIEPEQSKVTETSEVKIVSEEAMEIDGKAVLGKKQDSTVKSQEIEKEVAAAKAEDKIAEIKEPGKVEKVDKTLTKPGTREKDESATKSSTDVTKKSVPEEASTVCEKKPSLEKKVNETMDTSSHDSSETKPEKSTVATENKTDESPKILESTKAEPKTETETQRVASKEKSEESAKSTEVVDKVAEAPAEKEPTGSAEVKPTPEVKETTGEITEGSPKPEIAKNAKNAKTEAAKSESIKPEAAKTDKVKENGMPVEAQKAEKSEKSEKEKAPTIPEAEKDSRKSEAKGEEQAKSEVGAVPEKKEPEAKEIVPTECTDAKEEKVEAKGQDKKEEPEEKAQETKEAAASEAAETGTKETKLNGSKENGEAVAASAAADQPHSNGLNDEASSAKVSEVSAAQNGEPESSSDVSTESIKVKKVVDSTIADGAGEPDVVTPVVVAATS